MVIGLSIMGIKDSKFNAGYPINGQNLLVPDVLIETYEERQSKVLRPTCDLLWNAVGYEKSQNIDDG